MNYVLDASALIYLGKLKILEKLKFLRGEIYITPLVYEEVIKKGHERKEPEVKYIEYFIKNKKFLLKGPDHLIEKTFSLTKADIEVISLSKEIKAISIIDEKQARAVANSHGLENHGTIYLIIKLLDQKAITKEEAIKCIDKIIELGFYLSLEKYKGIINTIERIG